MIHSNNQNFKLSDYISEDDVDARGMRLLINSFGNTIEGHSSNCTMQLTIFDAFSDYIMGHIRERVYNGKLDVRVMREYHHRLAGAKSIHCLYHGEIIHGCFSKLKQIEESHFLEHINS